MFSKPFLLDFQFTEWICTGKTLTGSYQIIIGIPFIFVGHIIVFLNDNYCIASIVAKHCVEHKICYKGFDQV